MELNRGGTSDLPSRAADNLFWLGRYAERCEHLARVLRCILVRLTGESGAGSPATLRQRGVEFPDEAARVAWNRPIRAWRRTTRRAISTSRGISNRKSFL